MLINMLMKLFNPKRKRRIELNMIKMQIKQFNFMKGGVVQRRNKMKKFK